MSDQVYDILRDRIVARQLPPGEALRQDSLAVEFDISKVPLREALARLDEIELVRLVSNKGFIATPLSSDEFEEIHALRLALEPHLAANAAVLSIGAAQERLQPMMLKLQKASTGARADAVLAFRHVMAAIISQDRRPSSTKLGRDLSDRSLRYLSGAPPVGGRPHSSL